MCIILKCNNASDFVRESPPNSIEQVALLKFRINNSSKLFAYTLLYSVSQNSLQCTGLDGGIMHQCTYCMLYPALLRPVDPKLEVYRS